MQGLEDVKGIVGVMRAELGVVVLAHLRGRGEVPGLRNVVRPPHADESPALERVLAAAFVAEGLDQRGDVVGVAGDDLDESIAAGHQYFVVDRRARRATPKPNSLPWARNPLGPESWL